MKLRYPFFDRSAHRILDADHCIVSLDTIDRILKAEGFAPLPKRTRQQRLAVIPPEKFSAPASEPLLLTDEQFLTEAGVGPLVFLPLLEQLGIVKAIDNPDAGHKAIDKMDAYVVEMHLLSRA